ncbi:MAG: PAS domain-containing protein [Phormidium sp. BM_Day4_Bin.17]|nr:PAS domain-containing protein [Phormidium sp. BM_Day4_Bin.17]UCJ12537.1 MAG: PAS domain-containing protein [Phormidium sp. PBR-2020]
MSSTPTLFPEFIAQFLDLHPPAIAPETPLSDIWEQFQVQVGLTGEGASSSPSPSLHSGYVCVMEGDRCLGLITTQEAIAVLAQGHDPRSIPVSRLISPGQAVITPDTLNHPSTLYDAAQQHPFLLLLDDEQHCLGVLPSVALLKLPELADLPQEFCSLHPFEIALNHLPITVFRKDRQLRYTWIYKSFPGLDPNHMLGHGNHDLFSPADAEQWEAIERRALEHNQGSRQKIALTLNGTFHYYDLTVEPLFDDSGSILGLVGTALEITPSYLNQQALIMLNQELENLVEERTAELQRSNAELLASLSAARELNELKSRFITLTSHEFRTPLTTILGSAELLKHYGQNWKPEKRQRYLDRIHETVDHMTRLLNDVLTVGNAEAGRLTFSPSLVNLLDLFKSEIETARTKTYRDRTIELSHDLHASHLYLDQTLVSQIVSNLLSNALKYSSADSAIEVYLKSEENQVRFQVRDEGMGIPEADQADLFTSFHRAKNAANIQGTGLGLCIVKNAVHLHGGQVTVESQEGSGSTFTVLLPLTQSVAYDDNSRD